MAKQIRIGVLGLTHDHIWDNLPDVQDCDATCIVAAADPHQELLGRFEREFHGRPYTNYETMLNSEQLDAVYVYADNASGPELTEAACRRGLHVLVEKPMASDARGARRMLAAAQDAQVRLLVNWPFAWWPQMQHAIRLALEGEIGQVWQVRYRAAHAGPRELGCSQYFCDWLFDPRRNGKGGAFMEYCCYGAVLARVVLGMPESASALAARVVKEDIDVEDNAILLMTYPHALAVSEGSWTQVGKLSAYMTLIYGTAGTLMLEPRPGGRLFLATADDPQGSEVAVPGTPPHLRSATAHFAHCVSTGEPSFILTDSEVCCDTQRILDAGIESIETKQQVTI